MCNINIVEEMESIFPLSNTNTRLIGFPRSSLHKSTNNKILNFSPQFLYSWLHQNNAAVNKRICMHIKRPRVRTQFKNTNVVKMN